MVKLGTIVGLLLSSLAHVSLSVNPGVAARLNPAMIVSFVSKSTLMFVRLHKHPHFEVVKSSKY